MTQKILVAAIGGHGADFSLGNRTDQKPPDTRGIRDAFGVEPLSDESSTLLKARRGREVMVGTGGQRQGRQNGSGDDDKLFFHGKVDWLSMNFGWYLKKNWLLNFGDFPSIKRAFSYPNCPVQALFFGENPNCRRINYHRAVGVFYAGRHGFYERGG